MPNAQTEETQDINAMFNSAPEPEFNDYSDLVGRHIWRIDRCAAEMSRSFKRMLVWEYTCVTVPKAGREFVDRNMLETPQNMGWLKVRLRQRGVNVDDAKFDLAAFLKNGTGIMIGKLVDASIVEGKPSDTGQRNFNMRDSGNTKELGSSLVTDADVAAWDPTKHPASASGQGATGSPANDEASAPAAGSDNPWKPVR